VTEGVEREEFCFNLPKSKKQQQQIELKTKKEIGKKEGRKKLWTPPRSPLSKT